MIRNKKRFAEVCEVFTSLQDGQVLMHLSVGRSKYPHAHPGLVMAHASMDGREESTGTCCVTDN